MLRVIDSVKADEKNIVSISLCISFNLKPTKTEVPMRLSAFELCINLDNFLAELLPTMLLVFKQCCHYCY